MNEPQTHSRGPPHPHWILHPTGTPFTLAGRNIAKDVVVQELRRANGDKER